MTDILTRPARGVAGIRNLVAAEQACFKPG